MLKKTVLTFLFLTLLTAFYGFNANFGSSSSTDDIEPEPQIRKELSYVISPYDHLMRSISEESGNDWRLISAIAYHESRFTPDIVSHRGACGLMQIMPAVARQFNITSSEELFDPETNIRVGNQVLNQIYTSLRLPAEVPQKDRMSLALACYNGGIGHVDDARRLARVNGEDPNSWEVVSRYLDLKADSTYYESDVVRCGKFTGSEQTRAFVDDVMSRYDKYCSMAQ